MITLRQLQRMNSVQIDSLSDLCPITVDGVIRWQLLKVGHHADSHSKPDTNPEIAKSGSGTTHDDSQSEPGVKRELEENGLGTTSDDSQSKIVRNSVFREKYAVTG